MSGSNTGVVALCWCWDRALSPVLEGAAGGVSRHRAPGRMPTARKVSGNSASHCRSTMSTLVVIRSANHRTAVFALRSLKRNLRRGRDACAAATQRRLPRARDAFGCAVLRLRAGFLLFRPIFQRGAQCCAGRLWCATDAARILFPCIESVNWFLRYWFLRHRHLLLIFLSRFVAQLPCCHVAHFKALRPLADFIVWQQSPDSIRQLP